MGEFAQGTTMAVSYMTLSLDSWYRNLSYAERVARMYSPQTSPEQVGALHDRRGVQPGPDQPGDHQVRRDRPFAGVGAGAARTASR